MPETRRKIVGSAYNPEVQVLAFRLRDISILVDRNRILINKVKDEAESQMVIDWIARVVNGDDEQEIKLEGTDA